MVVYVNLKGYVFDNVGLIFVALDIIPIGNAKIVTNLGGTVTK